MRIRWTWSWLLLVAVATARAQETAPEALPDLKARIDAYLKPLVEMGMFSGAVLVAKDGQVIETACGKADFEAGTANEPSTQFKLMSVSKSITAVAVMRLVQARKLDLEDPVARHLPGWPATWRSVTVHHLLDHTSAIRNLEQEWAAAARASGERGLRAWEQLVPKLADRPLDAEAGSRHSYSNFNYVVLGLVVEAVTGRTYPDVLRTEVLGPAGMERTGIDDGERHSGLSIGYFRGKDGAPASSVQDMSTILGAGGFYSTVGDLYRLDRALRGDTLLRAETRRRMLTPTQAGGGYACGWIVSQVHERYCIHHSGGANGYVADLLRFPDDDACVVVLSNFAFAPAGRISQDLAGLLFGKAATPARRVARATLDGWAGIYRPAGEAGGALLIRRSGDVLLCFDARNGVERCAGRLLLPVADDLFALPWGAEQLSFTAAEGGRPARVRPGPGATDMERADAPLDAWRAAAGAYVTEPRGEGPTRIVEKDGCFSLLVKGGFPPEQEILPLTESLALTLYSEEFATLFHLERDDKGRVVRFRRQRNDGQDVQGVRQGD